MNGILLRGHDDVIESRAKKHGLTVIPHHSPPPRGEGEELPFEKTLIVEAGTRVPWDLLPAAWHFLERWDAAVPLWRYGVLAADVGGEKERNETESIIRDLRVLLHSVELIFVKNNEAGKELLKKWQDELAKFEDGDLRLAFLRAMYQVKPRLCVLPTTWLAEVKSWHPVQAAQRRATAAARPMVTVELSPGKFVKVHAGDENKVKAFDQRRNDMAVVSNKSFTLENEKTRAGRGPLVRVQIGSRLVKMYEQDAIAAGHLQPKAKAAPPAEDKAIPAEADKGEAETAPPDDFTSIDGVGPATARMLAAHGINTFEALREADLGFLSAQARQAVDEWRSNG